MKPTKISKKTKQASVCILVARKLFLIPQLAHWLRTALPQGFRDVQPDYFRSALLALSWLKPTGKRAVLSLEIGRAHV